MLDKQEKSERKRKRSAKEKPRDQPSKRSKKVKEVEQKAEVVKKVDKKLDEKVELAVAQVNGNVESTVVAPVVKKAKKEKKSKHHGPQPWSISEPVGGWFLLQDPVFSSDEKFIILATRSHLQIYSVATSLLVRSLKVTPAEITSYALSESKPTQIFAATSTGLITSWDLDTGKRLGRWDMESDIHGIVAILPPGGSQDIMFTQEAITNEAGKRNVINAHILRTGAQTSESEVKMALKTDKSIISFQVLSSGGIIVVALQGSIMIGKAQSSTLTSLKDLVYVWREFKVQESITSFHARVAPQSGSVTLSKKGSSKVSLDSLDLAVGCADGAIVLYDDILSKLQSIEKAEKSKNNKPEQSDNLLPRRLHWHRDGVPSLKWSNDGNYLISGGKETVLVIWQLTTGKKQHLPHLTSEIECVVVSPSSTSYAVRLADNSLMVLSTTELKPKTSIAGIQSRRVLQVPEMSQTTSSTSLLGASNSALAAFGKIPVVISPLNPNQTLLPIPSSQPRSEMNNRNLLPAPYLQVFDISTARHVSRQALTRNNATNFIQGPNRIKLQEPDVKLMKLSHDGKWLATVEEWAPPITDVDHIGESDQNVAKEQSLRREIYLKFWQWDAQKSTWMLEARIESPHRLPDQMSTCQVFDLASHPTEVGFATIGEDSFVRFWRPKIRQRDGTVVRSATAEALITWSNRSSVELESSIEGPENDAIPGSPPLPQNACLAYSTDGSTLAASQDWGFESAPGLVHLISTKSSNIHRSLPDLGTSKLAALAFAGRYLVVVSASVTVWDLVDDELSYTHSVDLYTPKFTHTSSLIHLAVNTHDNTFAVAFPDIQVNALPPRLANIKAPKDTKATSKVLKARSKIIIFDPSTPKPVYDFSLTAVAMSLLPTLNGSGYITLDSAAELRIINPKARAAIPLFAPIAEPKQSLATTEDIEADVADMDIDDEEEVVVPEAVENDEIEDMIEDTENDKPVVRPEHLAEIFDAGHSYAAQSMRELFSSVVDLYARKPRVRWEQDLTGTA